MLNFYKMISATSFSQSILWIEPTLQALPRNSSSSSVNFSFPISLLLVQKIILTIPTNTPFIYITQQFFTSLFLHTTIATIYTKNISPTLNIPYQLRLLQGSRGVMEYCENWHCFNLSLLPQSMDSDSRAHSQSLILYRSNSKNWYIAGVAHHQIHFL